MLHVQLGVKALLSAFNVSFVAAMPAAIGIRFSSLWFALLCSFFLSTVQVLPINLRGRKFNESCKLRNLRKNVAKSIGNYCQLER
jgi:hypothetical protein